MAINRTDSIDTIVVNYKTPADLSSFGTSYRAFGPSEYSSLTVVNVCPEVEDIDAAFELKKMTPYYHTEREYGPAGIINLYSNVGYARAVNTAATLGHAPTIAIFNADTELTPGLLDGCTAALWGHDDWGVLGPRQYDHRGRLTHAGIFGTLEAPKHRGWQETDHGQFSDVKEAVTVSGSAYFIKRKVWDELTECPLYREVAPDAEGAFLPTKMYYEETYCSYHCNAHNWKIIYYGLLGMVHKWHQSSPVGGYPEQVMPESRAYFREACDHHGIEHD